MAKAAHLSLLTPFLIGFLLVLVVSDVAYVCGQRECISGGVVWGHDCGEDCDNACISASNFAVSHTECGTFLTLRYCECCRSH
ncbi:hypothetical protein MKW94_003887 [Papaver nudicaule]|uniref:Defensin n=1 Tax=Papaver nudicaule TaxID=74823 RepID=A0AA41VQ43_PAPNU|nr:hypothetical protein [Papaver nudicaule]